ncbi:pirin family protein [Clostridium sp. LY3-2]|uniref:pirin family protein n=1 Tax=Clostridium sp. LY3-2 TaxID=2942482 RepID=UPI0021539C6F|nr:pirin family protein [Clostridium sp. LY3-2]MCR6515937.1 pirin family protein [Clostridium sp. LY3-2]
MKKLRTVETSFKGSDFYMVGDGFRVSQYFPSNRNILLRFSPFILLNYNAPFYFEPSNFKLGVGAHPHRGFEIVTIPYAGYVNHKDNKGHSGVVGPYDVQWITAGSGMLHKEYHEKEFTKKGGVLHMVELWINLPYRNKMTHPKYQFLSKSSIGTHILEENNGEIQVIAGEALGTKGPAETFSKINLYNVYLRNFGKVTLNEPSNFNTGILIVDGNLVVNNKMYLENEFIIFDNVRGDIQIESLTESSLFLVLSGESIREPVVFDGPFVLATEEDLLKAYDDFDKGRFGSFEF